MAGLISTFFSELLFALGLILAFGACGFGFVSFITIDLRHAILGAPLAGALAVSFASNGAYVLLQLGHTQSELIAAVSCAGLTAVRLLTTKPSLDKRSALVGLCGVLLISAVAVLTLDSASIRLGGPAIFYIDGSDHGGYAHVADWLNSHRIQDWPGESPDRPYESWPAYMFAIDPRFGAYSLLAIISTFHQSSAIFSYDIACSVMTVAAVLGVAVVFTRTMTLAILLALGLFISHWFDYAHSGYFGKLVGYPASLFLCGLTLSALREISLEKLAALLILAAAVGTMHSGAATTFLCAPVFIVALIASAVWREHNINISAAAILCSLVAFVPLVSSGVIARPLAGGYPDYNLSWSYILPRILDLENQGVALSRLSPMWLQAQVVITAAAWIALFAIAVRCRNVLATGILGGSAILLIGTLSAGAGAIAFQLIGFFYPAILCGALALAINVRVLRTISLSIAFLLIAQRIPRFAGATERFAWHQSEESLFSAAEMDTLASEIGLQTVRIDVGVPQPAILLLIELGRRKLNLEWSQRGWDTILRYRHWSLPAEKTSPDLTLTLRSNGTRYNHFEIMRERR